MYVYCRSILKLRNRIPYPLLFELSRNIEKGFEFPTGERILRQTTAVVATNFSPLLPTRLLNIHKSKISFEFQGLHKRVEKEKTKENKGEKKCKFLCSAKIHWLSFKKQSADWRRWFKNMRQMSKLKQFWRSNIFFS